MPVAAKLAKTVPTCHKATDRRRSDMGRIISHAALGITCIALTGGIAAAQPAPARPASPRPAAAAPAPTAAPAAPADKKPDPAFEAARTSFEALPEADRRALQEALVWTGDFNGVDSGTFGRRTYDSILAYARRAKPSADAVLDAAERAALLAAGRKARDAAGFALRTDAATGAALGVPARVLPREQRVPNGTRWQSPDGRVTLETRLYAAGEGDLAATFERLALSTPERRVTYKLKRPDFLVVTGETPTGRFYIRYADTPAGLRGFTFAYDKALAAETDKLVIAVANSFNPLPGSAGPAITTPTTASPVPVSPITPSGTTITAIEVAPGRLLTSAAAVAACMTPRINFKAARVIARSDRLALLGAPEPGAPRPGPALRSGPEPRAGDALIVLASDGSAASAIPAEAATATRVTAPLQPGAAGAPVFDRAGRLVGLVASYPGAPRLIAGVAPPAGYDMLPLAGAATFLRENGVTFANTGGEAPGTTGEVAGAAGPAIRSLTCGT